MYNDFKGLLRLVPLRDGVYMIYIWLSKKQNINRERERLRDLMPFGIGFFGLYS